jgi:hypothetical protein
MFPSDIRLPGACAKRTDNGSRRGVIREWIMKG